MTGETAPTLPMEDAVDPAMAVDNEEDEPIEKSRSSRPVDYRSLASLIAEVQRPNDRM
jgi:hypothetical protein